MFLGVDVSEREVAVILARPDGGTEIALRAALPRVGGANAQWLAATETIRQTLLKGHAAGNQIQAAGVAFFAPLDENQLVRKDARGANWVGFDVRRALREHLNISDSRVETRVRCEALAERKQGALREANNWLYIHLGETLEAAAMCDGVLLKGASSAALELGAVCIERDGELGISGRRGALDAYCGTDAFMTRARSYGLTFPTPLAVWQAAEANFMAKSLCDDFALRLAQGVGIACALLNPSRLVLGGELFHSIGAALLTPLGAHVKEYSLPAHFQSLEIVAGQLGSDAAVLGAVALSMEGERQP